jgi:hypothetical protein
MANQNDGGPAFPSIDRPSVYEERGEIHISAHGKPVTVEIGVGETVTIDKCFGPLIFTKVRVRADFQSCEWVVERQRIDCGEWIEVARIPGQMDEEYDEAHPNHREWPQS